MLEENSWCSLFADAFWIPKKDSLEFIDTQNCRIFRFKKRRNFWKKRTNCLFKINFKSKHHRARLENFNLACSTVHTCEESSLVILAKEYTLQAYFSVFCLCYFDFCLYYSDFLCKLRNIYQKMYNRVDSLKKAFLRLSCQNVMMTSNSIFVFSVVTGDLSFSCNQMLS